jgi:hypothetical protein
MVHNGRNLTPPNVTTKFHMRNYVKMVTRIWPISKCPKNHVLETTDRITHDSEKSPMNESGVLLAGSHEICHQPLSPKLPRERVLQENKANLLVF